MKPESFQGIFPARFVAQTLSGISSAPRSDGTSFEYADSEYTEVVTDSRKIQPGCLFVALVGEKFDGHQFIAQAVEQRASGIVCKTGTSVAPGVHTYPVADTQEAYRALGAAWRKQFDLPVVAVAGSVGKTTTKELLAAIFRGKWKNTLKTEGSQNGFVGIPMTLLALRKSHEAAVIEVGIDEIGAMQKHMDLIQADAAMLTTIGPEHLEFLKDVPTVAREEALALRSIDRSGGAIAFNLDDPWVRPLASELHGEGRRIHYHLSTSPLGTGAWTLAGTLDPQTSDLLHIRESDTPSDRQSLEHQNLEHSALTFTLKLPLPGLHNALNLLGAVAMARVLGLSPSEIQSGLQSFQGITGRSEVGKSAAGNTVICDFYNASPPSTVAGIELLSRMGQDGKRWACLGDMLELGPQEESFHRELSEKITQSQVDEVLLYGPRMKWLQDELTSGPFKGQTRHFENHDALASVLLAEIGETDVVLIKGSRGMRMEEIWKRIEKAPKRDSR